MPANKTKVIWMALLYFQLALFGIMAFLASQKPHGIHFGFAIADLQKQPNMALAVMGLLAGVAGLTWKQWRPQTGSSQAMLSFIVPLIALEMCNLMGFLLGFLNDAQLGLMTPFFALTIVGFLTNRTHDDA